MAWIRTQDDKALISAQEIRVDTTRIRVNGQIVAFFDTEEDALSELEAIDRWLCRGAPGTYKINVPVRTI